MVSGRLPKLPVNFDELEARAHATMPPRLVSCVAGGSGNEHTQKANVAAFERRGLIPRMLVGAEKRDLSIDLFGHTLPSPIFMSPRGRKAAEGTASDPSATGPHRQPQDRHVRRHSRRRYA